MLKGCLFETNRCRLMFWNIMHFANKNLNIICGWTKSTPWPNNYQTTRPNKSFQHHKVLHIFWKFFTLCGVWAPIGWRMKLLFMYLEILYATYVLIKFTPFDRTTNFSAFDCKNNVLFTLTNIWIKIPTSCKRKLLGLSIFKRNPPFCFKNRDDSNLVGCQ